LIYRRKNETRSAGPGSGVRALVTRFRTEIDESDGTSRQRAIKEDFLKFSPRLSRREPFKTALWLRRVYRASRPFIAQRSKRTIQEDAEMTHAYQINEAVLHRGQGPQGRVEVEAPKVYTIVQRMPVEADGRLRYRIRSDKVERIVTEDELSYCQ
jgi:hypothetical protein